MTTMTRVFKFELTSHHARGIATATRAGIARVSIASNVTVAGPFVDDDDDGDGDGDGDGVEPVSVATLIQKLSRQKTSARASHRVDDPIARDGGAYVIRSHVSTVE
jgi:hypothetical protein